MTLTKPALFAALSAAVGLAAPPAAGQEEAARIAARASEAFALDVHRALAADGGNLFCSPYSIHVALAMTREGARARTAEQLDRVLHLPGGSPGDGQRALRDALRPPVLHDGVGESRVQVPAYELHVAQAVWGQRDVDWLDGFRGRLDACYGAPLRLTDFARTEAARRAVNAWVEEQTRNRIREIVPPGSISRATVMALVNAVWFQAAWRTPFPEKSTAMRPFALAAGDRVEVSTMVGVQRGWHARLDGIDVLELPYRGNAMSMLILLPGRADGLPELEKELASEQLARWTGALQPRRIQLQLPRFEITRRFDLVPVLRHLGLSDAFDSRRADFSAMTPRVPIFVSNVFHKAFISVDETGTEAAAATVVLMKRNAVPEPSVAVAVDRSFLFLIRHRQTGLILFTGRVEDPRP